MTTSAAPRRQVQRLQRQAAAALDRCPMTGCCLEDEFDVPVSNGSDTIARNYNDHNFSHSYLLLYSHQSQNTKGIIVIKGFVTAQMYKLNRKSSNEK